MTDCKGRVKKPLDGFVGTFVQVEDAEQESSFNLYSSEAHLRPVGTRLRSCSDVMERAFLLNHDLTDSRDATSENLSTTPLTRPPPPPLSPRRSVKSTTKDEDTDNQPETSTNLQRRHETVFWKRREPTWATCAAATPSHSQIAHTPTWSEYLTAHNIEHELLQHFHQPDFVGPTLKEYRLLRILKEREDNLRAEENKWLTSANIGPQEATTTKAHRIDEIKRYIQDSEKMGQNGLKTQDEEHRPTCAGHQVHGATPLGSNIDSQDSLTTKIHKIGHGKGYPWESANLGEIGLDTQVVEHRLMAGTPKSSQSDTHGTNIGGQDTSSTKVARIDHSKAYPLVDPKLAEICLLPEEPQHPRRLGLPKTPNTARHPSNMGPQDLARQDLLENSDSKVCTLICHDPARSALAPGTRQHPEHLRHHQDNQLTSHRSYMAHPSISGTPAPMPNAKGNPHAIRRRPHIRPISQDAPQDINMWFTQSGIKLGNMADTPERKERVMALAYTYRDCFVANLEDIIITDLCDHPIDIDPAIKPFRHRQFRYTPYQQEYSRVLFPSMESAGVIKRMMGPGQWAANTIFRPKPDGRVRTVHDFRPVNTATIRNQYPVHSIEEDLDGVLCGDPRVCSKTDAANGYWGLPVREGDEEKTGFIAPHGFWCYLTAAQGLACAMQSYCRFGDTCLGWLPPLDPASGEVGDESILGHNPITGDTCVVYVDDHTMTSTNFESHFAFLRDRYFPRIAFGPIPLSPKKTVLFSDNLEFVGFYIENGRITPLAKHRQRFAEWKKRFREKPPESWEEIQDIMWLTPFLRRFIPGRADLERIIRGAFFESTPTRTPKGRLSVKVSTTPRVPVAWGQDHANALDEICDAVQNNALSGVDYSLPFHLATDASDTGLGGVLFQLPDDRPYSTKRFDEMRILIFFSFKLTDPETRYSMPEKEMLAIVKATKQIDWVLGDSPFPTRVYTDHLSIIQTMSNLGEVHGKVARWIDRITEFRLEFYHRPNTDRLIRVADGLSRLRVDLQGDLMSTSERAEFDMAPKFRQHLRHSHLAHLATNRLCLLLPLGPTVDHQVPTEQLEDLLSDDMDEWYGDMIKFMLEGEAGIQHHPKHAQKNIRKKALKFRLLDGVLYREEVDASLARCIARYQVPFVLRWAHEEHGHYAPAISIMRLRGRFWWPTRIKDNEEHYMSCQACAQVGARVNRPHPLTITSLEPMQLVGMDFIGPLNPVAKNGSKYILLAVDYFSRFVMSVDSPLADGVTVINAWMQRWSPMVGWPKSTYSDNGSHFQNEITKTIMEHHGTRMIFGPVSHPSSTGLSERSVRLVKQQLMKWSAMRKGANLDEWNIALPELILNINSRHIPSLGFSPAMAFLGFEPQKRIAEHVGRPRLATPDDFDDVDIVAGDVSLRVENSTHMRETLGDMLACRADSRTSSQSGISMFEKGEWVWEKRDKPGKSTSKFDASWTGPMEVIERASEVSYWIKPIWGVGNVRKIHVSDLKSYRHPHELLDTSGLGSSPDNVDILRNLGNMERGPDLMGREMDLRQTVVVAEDGIG